MNNSYKITVESPLLRPGLKIETTVSEKYLIPAHAVIMDKIRSINDGATENGGVNKLTSEPRGDSREGATSGREHKIPKSN